MISLPGYSLISSSPKIVAPEKTLSNPFLVWFFKVLVVMMLGEGTNKNKGINIMKFLKIRNFLTFLKH